MKRISTTFCILTASIVILVLSGCKTNSHLQCPDLASTKKIHAPVFAMGHAHSNKLIKPAQAASAQVTTPNATLTQATALVEPAMHLKIRMPNALTQNLQSDQDLDDMNKLLANYSDNKVALQRNNQGKLFLKAHSVKDIFALAKKAYHPRGYYERRYGNGGDGGDANGAAIASGVLGPIGFVFAFIPFLSLGAIAISIAAIITGAIGLKSHRPRMATMGLTFGILGLIISILFSWLYFAIWVFA